MYLLIYYFFQISKYLMNYKNLLIPIFMEYFFYF